MMRKTMTILSMAAASIAAPAMAQDTGSHLVRNDQASVAYNAAMSPADRTRLATVAYATCQLQRNRVDVERAAALPPGPESDRAFARMLPIGSASSNFDFGRPPTSVLQENCLTSGELTTTPSLLRGAAYVAMYRRDFGRGSSTLIATAPEYSGERQAAGLLGFASCVVRRDTANSRQLILAPVTNWREQTAFSALSPAFTACLPTGMSLTFSKQVLEGYIAEVLYRETAPRGRR